MAGGPSKINPPNSHPSNSIHKVAQPAQKNQPAPDAEPSLSQGTPSETRHDPEPPQQEISKTAVIIGVVEVRSS